jgi:hypothetical protein
VSELDAALERFDRTAPEWGGGLANHGPMAAEALAALGHPALIPGFVERYAPRLAPLGPGKVLAREERVAALGDPQRTSDWIATWRAELGARPWPDVLREAIAELVPGLFASAAHGLLRTAHAVRSLEAEDSPLRRGELAHGLGLWSARHQELPGRPGAAPVRAPSLDSLEPIPPELRSGGLFFDQVRVLDRHPPFRAWLEGLDLLPDVDASIATLTREAAALYLGHRGGRIAYAHTVTAPSALRLLAPHLPDEVLRLAVGRAWQAVGALHAVSYAPEPPDPAERAAAERVASDTAEIRYRAACSMDDHSIKLTEVCLREDAAAPDSILRLAAADAALHLGGTQRSC